MISSPSRKIIEIATKLPWATMTQILKHLDENFSQSSCYRVISDLIDQHILVKENKKIFLNKTWVLEYLALWDTMKKNYLDTTTVDWFLDLQEWEIKTYEWTSLQNIDAFWWDVTTKLSILYGEQHDRWYYNSHPYHIIGMQSTESRVLQLSSVYTNSVNFLFGNTTPLDTYGAELLKLVNILTACVDSEYFPREWYLVNVINDFIIQLTLPKEITEYFAFIFKNTNALEEFNAWLFSQICHMKWNYHLRVHRDGKKADEFRKKIQLEMG